LTKTTYFKVDVDVKMSDKLLDRWITTRIKMLEWLGFQLVDFNFRETEKGYHFWFGVQGEYSPKTIAKTQFLLGDDQTRCKFNFLRLEADCFHEFNCLFNKKLKLKNKKRKGG